MNDGSKEGKRERVEGILYLVRGALHIKLYLYSIYIATKYTRYILFEDWIKNLIL